MSRKAEGKMPYELFGDGTEPETTRERILEYAQDLFYSQGFHAVGIDEIVAKAGVTKATFYNHFESRDMLIADVIRKADGQIHERFVDAVRQRGGWDAKAALMAMFDVLDVWFNHPDFHGCLFLKACMAFPNEHDPIHKAARAHYVVTCADIAEMATALPIEDTESFAEEWILLIEGALSFRAVCQDDRAARIAKRMAKSTLERWTTSK
ncbi:MAG: TetR/AcrR family transcriptional regulator [Bythopirellula sp.]